MKIIIFGVIFAIIYLLIILPIDERSDALRCLDPDGKLDKCITDEMFRGVSHRLAVDKCTDQKSQQECFEKLNIRTNAVF